MFTPLAGRVLLGCGQNRISLTKPRFCLYCGFLGGNQKGKIMSSITYTSTELGQKTGEVLHKASNSAVMITQHAKARYVLMPIEQYTKIIKSNDPRIAGLTKDMPDELKDEVLKDIDAYLSEH